MAGYIIGVLWLLVALDVLYRLEEYNKKRGLLLNTQSLTQNANTLGIIRSASGVQHIK
jgi:hypothetical protein